MNIVAVCIVVINNFLITSPIAKLYVSLNVMNAVVSKLKSMSLYNCTSFLYTELL